MSLCAQSISSCSISLSPCVFCFVSSTSTCICFKYSTSACICFEFSNLLFRAAIEGEYYYCALPKGPLVQDHVLVIPVEHSPNTISTSPECEKELGRFQNSLKMYYKKQGKEVVFSEWLSKRGTHANLQAVPIPTSKAGAVQDIFNLAAEKLGFKFLVMKSSNNSEGRRSLRTQFDGNCSFFYVELPGGTILSHVVEKNERFPAQFGREVLAGLLNIADRADWRNSMLSKEEEMKMAEDFKKLFEEFDPNQ